MKNRKLLVSRIITPDGTVLESKHRHDYVEHLDKNGETYMLDGGIDYIRTNINKEEAKPAHIFTDDSHEIIREGFTWGTRGKTGKDTLRYVVLKDLTTEHIQAILDTQMNISEDFRKVFLDELVYRKNL